MPVRKQPLKVRVVGNDDLLGVLEDLKSDGVPRVLERDGEEVAVVMTRADFGEMDEPKSKRNKDRLLALAGAWKSVDADALVEEIYKARHESPPSAPASF
jgi:PHD/YefM family antitoxin component YafN of YafNO toxin-antitoxin module